MADGLRLTQLFQIPQDAEQKLEDKTFVGIDFGTSTTVVSIASYDSNKKAISCETLQLEQMLVAGEKTENELLPTVMAKTDKGLLVGEGAYQLKGNPDYEFGQNIWYSFKMELGQDMGPRWTSITKLSLIKSPLDATTIFFKFVKREIEKTVAKMNLSPNIQYAVSIPASFESNQRLDLLRALKNNGIEMSGNMLIDEPNAAFIGYINPDYTAKESIQLGEGYNPKVLVFDFGAGTCDISILELSADYHGVHTRNISISQFTELGGNDIDRYIAYNYLLPDILKINGMTKNDYTTKQINVICQQLMGIAEHLKILCSKDFEYLTTDKDSLNNALEQNQGIKYHHPISIYTEYKDLKQEDFSFSYQDFINTMKIFLRHKYCNLKGQKRYNGIYGTIDSAIRKAHIDANEVDYVMLIGGSSKNPLVQQGLRVYFENARLLIPQDLQALVSQGAAIHSLLQNGLGITLVRPITSEPIVVILRGEKEISVIPAGTEIPIPQINVKGLTTGDKDQSIIEIPICVSNEKKVVANIKIEEPLGVPFPRNTPVDLTLDITADKVLRAKATCLEQECSVESENPFANTYLTDEDKKILQAERASYISADKNNGKPSKQSLIELRNAYIEADRNLQAAETYEDQIKYYPQNDLYNYIGVQYHNSGNYTKAIRYFKKAIDADPENNWAWANLGNDMYLMGENSEAIECLENSLRTRGDNTVALCVLGDIYRDREDVEKSKSYYERAYNIFIRRWNEDSLGDFEYGWFEDTARKLGKDDVAQKVADSKPKKKHSDLYSSANLITLDSSKKEDNV